MSAHLGAELPALVDGELDHVARERALAHLAGCAGCRAEVDEERRLKARLRDVGAAGPRPGDELAQRLLQLARTQGLRPGPGAALPDPRGRRSPLLPASSLLGPPPVPPPDTRGPVPRGVLGGAVLVLGLGAVLALGGPSRAPSRPSVDPTSDAFVADFASTGSRPLTGPGRTAPAGAR